MDEEAEPKRRSRPGAKTRRPNGPAALMVNPVLPPPRANLGAGHVHSYDVLESGPRGLIAAQHQAAKLAAKFGEQLETEWCLTTPWLFELFHGYPPPPDADDLSLNPPEHRFTPDAGRILEDQPTAPFSMQRQTERNRARARYALRWRPRVLAVVALTRSILLGSRAAKVSYNTVKQHRRLDPDFDRQLCAAQDQAIELLHDVTMRDAIEGTCEPVLWQGIPVAWVRKYDNRLRIEMLRAHMPDRFKTPGAKGVTVNTGDTINNTLIVDAAVQQQLVELRRAALAEIRRSREIPIQVQAAG